VWLSRLRFAWGRRRLDDEARREFDAHLELLADRYVRGGMTPERARKAARRQFGNPTLVREDVYRMNGLAPLDRLAQDLRYAGRQLCHNPIFTAVVVATLALAIGANTAIFSAVNAVLIRPLPYPDAERLVQVWETNPQAERWGEWASYPDFEDWSRESRAFEGLALYRYGRLRMTHGEYPEMLNGVRVAPSLFSVLRVKPMLGRSFLAEEDRPGATAAALLSYGLWQRHFGSDPTVVGRSISLDGRSHLVVGVMPPGFDFPTNLQPTAKPPDVWIPVVPDASRGSHNYRVVGRLKGDQTIAQAQSDMERVMRIVADVDPGHRGRGAAVAGLQQRSRNVTDAGNLFEAGNRPLKEQHRACLWGHRLPCWPTPAGAGDSCGARCHAVRNRLARRAPRPPSGIGGRDARSGRVAGALARTGRDAVWRQLAGSVDVRARAGVAVHGRGGRVNDAGVACDAPPPHRGVETRLSRTVHSY